MSAVISCIVRARQPCRPVVIIIISFALGIVLFVWCLLRPYREWVAISILRSKGATIGYDSSVAAWVQAIAGEAGVRLVADKLAICGEVSYLTLGVPQITDVELSHLNELRNVPEVVISRASVTDEGLVNLKSLRNLSTLVITDVPITNRGLCNVSRVSGLQELEVTNTLVTSSGLSCLRFLGCLKLLYIVDCPLGDGEWRALDGFDSLEMVWLEGRSIDDRALIFLENLSKIQAIYLRRTRISNQGIERLRKNFPNVQVVVEESAAGT